MTDGLTFEGGVFSLTQGGRLVMSTDRKHVLLAGDFGTIADPETITATYPDMTKGWAYLWRARSVRDAGLPGYSLGERGDGWITARPQEWSDTAVIATAPAGCNFFAARIRINRTTDPATTWFGQSIPVKPPENVWIPFSGSVLLEEMLGLCRAFSLYIDADGNLVRHMQHSVSVGPYFAFNNVNDLVNHVGATGMTKLGPHGLPAADGNDHDLVQWAYDNAGAFGLPVYQGPTQSTNVTYTVRDPYSPVYQGFCQRCSAFSGAGGQTDSHGNVVVGGNAAPVSGITTSWVSEYSIDIAGKWGRAEL